MRNHKSIGIVLSDLFGAFESRGTLEVRYIHMVRILSLEFAAGWIIDDSLDFICQRFFFAVLRRLLLLDGLLLGRCARFLI